MGGGSGIFSFSLEQCNPILRIGGLNIRMDVASKKFYGKTSKKQIMSKTNIQGMYILSNVFASGHSFWETSFPLFQIIFCQHSKVFLACSKCLILSNLTM